MFGVWLKITCPAEMCIGALLRTQNEIRQVHTSYFQLCIRNNATRARTLQTDLSKAPGKSLQLISGEAFQKLNKNMNLKYSCRSTGGYWLTSVFIEWPEKLQMTGVAVKKKESENIACRHLLKALVEKNVISHTGHLIPQYLSDEVMPEIPEVNLNTLNSEYTEVNDKMYSSLESLNSWSGSEDSLRLSPCSDFSESSHTLLRNNRISGYGLCMNNRLFENAICGVINSFQKTTVRPVHSSPTSYNIEQSGNDCRASEITTESQYSSRVKRKRKKSTEKTTIKNKDAEESSIGDQNVEVSGGELSAIERRYPLPRSVLNNFYVLVCKDLKSLSYTPQVTYHAVPVRQGKINQTMWNCTYKVKWPSEASFAATMSSKALAGKQAALRTLHWLQMQGKLTKSGAPLVYDPSEITEMAKIPPEITINPGTVEDIDLLTNFYKKNVEPLLNELDDEIAKEKSENDALKSDESMDEEVTNINKNIEDLFGTDEPVNPVTGTRLQEENSRLISQRNNDLYNRYKIRVHSDSKDKGYWGNLPITTFKSQILKMVEENQVLVIKGEPGCGKSTQVPQYLMEHWESLEKGAHCNIIITQPRRISATSLAEWIASERNERLGDVVGYQVRLRSILPKPVGGALLFCSTGILLRRLQNNPGLLGASHIILDEAHERDINTDMLLVLLRKALSLNPNLHLIIMSATINAELFQNYFNGAPTIHVPGFTYPVKSIFLEDIDISRVESSDTKCPIFDFRLIAKTIKWIDMNRPEGAILCFLSGWGEITAVSTLLQDLNKDTHLILPVHSRLSHAEQRRIFAKPPPGVRKIILATNIAETSITINDVKYVIDTGAHKEERLNIERGLSSLDNQWVSQANVNQRKGRAGRVQPGECFHLYTRQKYERMDAFPIPELLRVPLEKTVLDLKTYNQEYKAERFLSEMPEPPARKAIVQAVDELVHLGALDSNEMLTPLGRRIALFSLHPKLSKALVHAAIFKCVSPMLTIATILAGDAEMFLGGLSNRENVRYIKKRFHPSSDHVSLAWLYEEWKAILKESSAAVNDYCYERSLNNDSLNTVQKLRKLYAEHLWLSRMLEDLQDFGDLDAPSNRYAGNDEFVKGVLYSGIGTLLYRRTWDIKGGRYVKDVNVVFTETSQRTTIASESVNHKRAEFPSPFLTYFRQIESSERRTVIIRETSILSPMSVFLFSEGTVSVHEYKPPPYVEDDQYKDHVLLKISRRKRDVVLLCHKSLMLQLAEFRIILWNMVNYFILKSGVEDDDERYKIMSSFHDRLLKTIGKLMFTSGSMIEYDKDGNKLN